MRAFFEDSVSAADTAAALGARLDDVRQESGTGAPESQAGEWEPLLAGERFYIVPPGFDGATPAGRFRLEIEASTAFGTGRHETTQLCIEALERHIRNGDTLLDVGCGSGILLAAAGLLGAGPLLGSDISFDALTIARLHARAPLFVGSADAVREASFDISIANITPRILDRLAPELKRVTKPGGLVILSGFTREQQPERFRYEEMSELGDWQCWICRPETIAADAGGMLEAGVHEADWWL